MKLRFSRYAKSGNLEIHGDAIDSKDAYYDVDHVEPTVEMRILVKTLWNLVEVFFLGLTNNKKKNVMVFHEKNSVSQLYAEHIIVVKPSKVYYPPSSTDHTLHKDISNVQLIAWSHFQF